MLGGERRGRTREQIVGSPNPSAASRSVGRVSRVLRMNPDRQGAASGGGADDRDPSSAVVRIRSLEKHCLAAAAGTTTIGVDIKDTDDPPVHGPDKEQIVAEGEQRDEDPAVGAPVGAGGPGSSRRPSHEIAPPGADRIGCRPGERCWRACATRSEVTLP